MLKIFGAGSFGQVLTNGVGVFVCVCVLYLYFCTTLLGEASTTNRPWCTTKSAYTFL
jgi:hypothetical protein